MRCTCTLHASLVPKVLRGRLRFSPAKPGKKLEAMHGSVYGILIIGFDILLLQLYSNGVTSPRWFLDVSTTVGGQLDYELCRAHL